MHRRLLMEAVLIRESIMDVIEYGNPIAETVLIQLAGDHDIGTIKNEYDSIKENTEKEFRLIAMKVDDWNRDLSPWEAPAVFGKEGFGEGALNTLSAVRKYCADQNRKYYIGGYSLAGLFALWAAYQTDLFQGVAAASPSIWFPKFTEYMKAHEIKCPAVYLSLGDKEEKTRNLVMASVGEKIRQVYGLLKERGTDCTLEWNPGNHFRDPEWRMAKAFTWVMERKI